MVRDAESHAEKDKARKELIEVGAICVCACLVTCMRAIVCVCVHDSMG